MVQERRIELPIPNGRGILSPDRIPSSDTPAYGASKENRTPITSLEGWGNNRYTIPALLRPLLCLFYVSNRHHALLGA